MAKDFDFTATLKGLVELVEMNCKKNEEYMEHCFDWLDTFAEKAKKTLTTTTEEFKMPKTPARKKTRQQKKRVLHDDDEQSNGNHSSNDVPMKKGKLSHEDEEIGESIGGRPRRQASCAAKSKIQQSIKLNLKQKLRRPSGGHDGADQSMSLTHETDTKNHPTPMECGSPVVTKSSTKTEIHQTVTFKMESTSPRIPKDAISSNLDSKHPSTETLKVNFDIEAAPVDIPDNVESYIKCDKTFDKLDETHDISEPVQVCLPVVEEKPIDPPKKGRPPRKGKKVEDVTVEEVKVVESPPLSEAKAEEDSCPKEEKEIVSVPCEQEVPKKKTRKLRKPAEEKPVPTESTIARVASPRVTRTQKQRDSVRTSVTSVHQNSPRVEQTPSKRNLQFNAANSSPIRKVFTPKLVFSPFKPTSVKTKVEAFEAALGSSGTVASSKTTAVLPEARVLLKRLTDQELKDAGADRSPVQQDANAKRGTFVLNSPDEKGRKSERKSVAHMLARKSVDKAKLVALSAARNKLLNSVQSENPESPNVHVNKNASSIMSKFRFTNGSGSGSSSASSLNRYVAMTQAKTHPNVVTGVGTFTGTKPLTVAPNKASEEDEIRRKELELKRLKEKEEEAARKREELIKAKAEEQKRKHEARAKRAMEQRMLRAKQLGEEQKQKLENKEEKSAHLKQKLLAEHQEKNERIRIALMQKQQEAEQRRKAEMEQRQQQWEEEQRLAAAKKEQEEQEKLAKMRQLEAERARLAAAAAAAAATASAVAAPALNTTVTLPSSTNTNSYQITPVRVTKAGRIFNPDNYDIADMRSDDSTDDDSRPKKVIPNWARSVNLKAPLGEQAKGLIDTDKIFPPAVLLRDPNLNEIFKIKRARFDKRTSSAVWKTPPAHYL